MKSTITQLKKLAFLGVLVGGLFTSSTLKAQTPCSGTSSWGCGGAILGTGNPTESSGDILDVAVKNSKGTTLASYSGLGCTSSAAANSYKGILNSGKGFDVTASESITVAVTGGTWATQSWGSRIGIWIDANRDGSFDKSECMVDPSSNIISGLTSFTLKMPCWTSTGLSYMRIRGGAQPYTMSATNGCGQAQTYGNVFDLELNLKLGATPTANFIVPTSTNYVKTNVKFSAINPSSGYAYKWTFDKAVAPPYAGYSNKTDKGAAKWASGGTYDVKMVVDYCGLSDSASKTVTIVAPTVVPVADFVSSANESEIYFDVTMYDLSNNGAYSWSWELTSPTGVDNQTSSVQNPKFTLSELGWYKVCLTSSNDIGPSNKLCKDRYIECVAPTEYYMGPSKEAQSKTGRLYDNGGPTVNYGNNRKTSIDYFKIIPCGATKITLSFSELKLNDKNDILMIYDSKEATPNKLIATINADNVTRYDTAKLVTNSGAVYITFQSDANGTAAGFIINWKSVLAPAVKPSAKWTTAYNPAANGVNVALINASTNVKGLPTYEWSVDANPESSATDFNRTFFTDGSYTVCLIALTCTGVDTFCKTLTINTPTAPGYLDYKASNVRPNLGDVVTITTTTDYANMFEWSIFPTTFTFENGTTKNSQNPELKFQKGGAYTFTLSAYNSVGGKTATEKKLIKNKYVVCLDYCIPLVDLMSADVGINNVTLKSGSTELINNASTSGIDYFTYFDKVAPAKLTYGGTYDLSIGRNTISNSVNYMAWIDWNIDGDFADAGEEVFNSGTITKSSASGKFTVPDISNSFEGNTRLRVGVSYGTFSNTYCGINVVGEFEDYMLNLANDGQAPVITLVGGDTVRVEKTATKTACYSEIAGTTYKGSDATQGDMTSAVIVKSDLDCSAPGIYTFQFDLRDASGNNAVTKFRTIIVALDKTAPKLTLNGKDTMVLEQCDTYSEPGAVAIDANDGNLTSAIKIAGKVDAGTVGVYTLVYSVSDAQKNAISIKRVVIVKDTKVPSILKLSKAIVDGTTIDVQIGGVFVDDVYAMDPCNGSIFVSKNPGFNGPVNTNVRATYPVTYKATDPSGNKATEFGYVLNYRVDDYIAPDIELNTSDTVLHDVNNAYYSRSVTVSDNYYAKSQLSLTKIGKVDAYTLGTYVETFTATDGSGNVTTKQRFIKVVDRIAPAITAPAISVCIATPFWAMSGLIVRDNYYSSGDLMPLVKVLGHNVNVMEAGVYYINYSLVDPSGNEATAVSRPVYVSYPPNCFNTYMGTENMKLQDAVSVHPNPTTGLLTVGYNLTNNQSLNVVVTNAFGAVVSKLDNLQGGFGNTQIDLSNVSEGIYFVNLTNNGETVTKRVVVKH
jgi:PKD repeat protein